MNVLGRILHTLGRRSPERSLPERPEVDLSLWDLCILSDGEDAVQVVLAIPPLVATGSRTGKVVVWCVAPDRRGALLELTGHAGAVTCLARLPTPWPERCVLASGSVDGTCRLWCPTTGLNLNTLEGCVPHPVAIHPLPDPGAFAVVTAAGRVRVLRMDPADAEAGGAAPADGGASLRLIVQFVKEVDLLCTDVHAALVLPTAPAPTLVAAAASPLLHACPLGPAGPGPGPPLAAHRAPVTQLQPLDADHFCSADAESVVVWRSPTLQPTLAIALDQVLPALTGHLRHLQTWDGKRILLAAGSSFAVINVVGGRHLVEAYCPDAHGPGVPLNRVAWHPPSPPFTDGPCVLSSAEDGSVRFWQLSAARRSFRPSSPLTLAVLGPSGAGGDEPPSSAAGGPPHSRRISAGASSGQKGARAAGLAWRAAAAGAKGQPLRLTVPLHLAAELLGHTAGVQALVVIEPWVVVAMASDGSALVWLHAPWDRQRCAEHVRGLAHGMLLGQVQEELQAEGLQAFVHGQNI